MSSHWHLKLNAPQARHMLPPAYPPPAPALSPPPEWPVSPPFLCPAVRAAQDLWTCPIPTLSSRPPASSYRSYLDDNVIQSQLQPCHPLPASSPCAQEPIKLHINWPVPKGCCFPREQNQGAQEKWMQTPEDLCVLLSGFLPELLEPSVDQGAEG